jgi:DNA-binding transcriptional ArsR family regulator
MSRPSLGYVTPPDTDAAAPAAARALSPAEAARLFRVLGDEHRLRVLLALPRRGEMNVEELSEAVGMRQPALSHHPSWLPMAGVVACQRRGRYRYYVLAGGVVRELLRFVKPRAWVARTEVELRLAAAEQLGDLRGDIERHGGWPVSPEDVPSLEGRASCRK